MKITAIESYAVRVGIRNQLLVKVETDGGIHGRANPDCPTASAR